MSFPLTTNVYKATATPTTSNTVLKWPELYGFSIYGSGPSFVIYVEPTSIAETAGIKVGDRIIEIDNNDVSFKSSSFIKELANNSKKAPPAVSVQTFCKEVELIANSSFLGKKMDMNSFGLSISGDMPVIVDKCAQYSPAFLAGIRKGIRIHLLTVYCFITNTFKSF